MTRRRATGAIGAIGASLLLLAATACSSGDPTTDAVPAADSAVDAPLDSAVDTAVDAPLDTAVGATDPAAPQSPSDTAAQPAPDDAAVVPELLQFTAPLVGGGTFDGAASTGKPTVFWFWAPT